MTAADWPQIDGNAGHDLFGGDLFGDELMDIYNSAAVVDGGTADVNASEIPALGVPTSTDIQTTGNGADAVAVHPGAEMAMTAAAMDDGLGAFRPSTSFNDLTALIGASDTVEDSTTTMPSLTVAPAPPGSASTKKNKKKREAGSSKGGPTKKRATGQKGRTGSSGRRGGGTSKSTKQLADVSKGLKGTPQSAGQAALKLRKDQQVQKGAGGVNNNTPNPLMVGSGPANKISSRAIGHTQGAVKPLTTSSVPSSVTVAPRISGKAESITSEAAAATAAAAAAAAVVAGPSAGGTTEADFKSVAQAAVTNLIINAGQGSKSDLQSVAGNGKDEGAKAKVDTSTAHIKALTSPNWVTACASGTEGPAAATAAAAVVADSKANNRVRRQNLTPDERARQNRDRNREHARNTRLRKKAYVEELKRTLTELVAQRDATELEKRHTAQRELEQREVRFRVMEEFLKLRGRNEANFARWVAIIEDGFTLTLPVTNYRKMVHGENAPLSSEQILNGPEDVMADSSIVAALLQNLGSSSNKDTRVAPVSIVHQCDRKDFFMDGCNAVLEWTATSLGATGRGASAELSLRGTMHAKFCPASNKLISAKIMFDTGIVASQLQSVAAPVAESLTLANSDACDAMAAAAAAAQVAANEADALLDSLQMPQLANAVPTAITLVPSSVAVSISSSDKEDCSSDESLDDVAGKHDATAVGVRTRRSPRTME